jgi:hypothetical protein
MTDGIKEISTSKTRYMWMEQREIQVALLQGVGGLGVDLQSEAPSFWDESSARPVYSTKRWSSAYCLQKAACAPRVERTIQKRSC